MIILLSLQLTQFSDEKSIFNFISFYAVHSTDGIMWSSHKNKKYSSYLRIRNIHHINEPIKGPSAEDINASVDGNTITIDFLADFGIVDVSIETISGSTVIGTMCQTPSQTELYVSGTGVFILKIVSSSATFSGQFIIN